MIQAHPIRWSNSSINIVYKPHLNCDRGEVTWWSREHIYAYCPGCGGVWLWGDLYWASWDKAEPVDLFNLLNKKDQISECDI